MASQSGNVPANSTTEPVLVLGIDPGTTSFKIAVLEAEENSENQGDTHIFKDPNEQIVLLSHFPGFERYDSNNVPTALIYNENGELAKWGHHATNFQTHDGFDPSFLVEYWKLGLRTSSSPAARQLRRNLEATAERLGATPDKFIEDFFIVVRQFVLENKNSPLLEHLGGDNALQRFKHIDVVIALPPGWPRQEHRTFTSAATQGLGDARQLRIFTVSETECVLHQWITETSYKKKVKVGDLVVLLDLGGGTACISVFRCVAGPPISGKFRWEHIESHSLTAGSQIVTENFITDFQNRLKEAGVPITAQLVYKARKAFDKKKLSIGEEKTEQRWSIEVDGLKRDDPKEFANGRMFFKGQQLLNYFKASQDQVLGKVNEITGRVAREHSMPKFCVVAGAYGNNVIFKERLREMNATNNYRWDVKFSDSSGNAVVRGACLARIEGEFSQSSGSRYSVAVLIYMPWRKAIKYYPLAASRRFPGTKTLYSPVLEWKIKKGDPVMANHSIDADSKGPRQRFFTPDEEIIFSDTIYTSDSHPGDAPYTFLKYKTTNPADWKLNELDLLQRGIEVRAFEVTWDLKNVPLLQEDGSWGSMPREALPTNRAKTMQYLKYKYHIGVGQIDIKLSIESFFTKNRTNKMVMSHKQIVVMDEPESTTLTQEYQNLPDLTNDSNNEDEPSPAKNVPDGDILSPEQHVEEPAASIEGSLREYYAAQWSGTDGLNAKRQKRTNDASLVVTTQVPPLPHMLKEASFIAINQNGGTSRQLTHEEAQDGSSGAHTPTDPRGLPTARGGCSMQGSASRTSPRVNQPENTSESHTLQPLATSSPNSLQRPRQETLAALRTPVVESRKRSFLAVAGSRKTMKRTIDPFK